MKNILLCVGKQTAEEKIEFLLNVTDSKCILCVFKA